MTGARIIAVALAFSSLGSFGCAAVFRDSKVKVHVDSDPRGGAITYDERVIGATPMDPELERNSSTAVKISKDGYHDHRGTVPKHVNAGWVVVDVATCVIPVALCIPLLVDAITGAWMDVDGDYRVRLEPILPGVLVPPDQRPVAPPSDSSQPQPQPQPQPGQIDL